MKKLKQMKRERRKKSWGEMKLWKWEENNLKKKKSAKNKISQSDQVTQFSFMQRWIWMATIENNERIYWFSSATNDSSNKMVAKD